VQSKAKQRLLTMSFTWTGHNYSVIVIPVRTNTICSR